MKSRFVIIFPIICIIYIIVVFLKYSRSVLFAKKTPEIRQSTPLRLDFTQFVHPMERRDAAPMIIITVIYAAVAFFMLGNTDSPQSVCHYVDRGRYTDIELTEPTIISRMQYFTGLYTGEYRLQFSADGVEFEDQGMMPQSYAEIFRWIEGELLAQEAPVRVVRIIASDELEMRELALYDSDGNRIPVDKLKYDDGAAPLLDEQYLVPEKENFLNSTHFDEIYHARTALEHIEGVYPYEVSHPPLGKIIISLGIRMFGMTPFGWRFMGTLFGVFMLPFIYIFIKKMFGSTPIATCGLLIFAFDFMHFVQTRIATIDTYGVFFTILMYLFMYLFVASDMDNPREKKMRMRWLMLSGLCFGLGAASKWTCIYAGAGLAVIWLIRWIFRGRDLLAAGRKKAFKEELLHNIRWCLLFFVVIPCIIYYVSYYPYGKAMDMNAPSMFFNGGYAKTVLENQRFMFTYHSGVDAEHPYSSRWYQWVINHRPILYFLDGSNEHVKSAFGAFLNPMTAWGGLAAMICMCIHTVKDRSGKALFILIGYLAQLVPWFAISRVVFEYHYFPCIIFLTFALCYVFDSFRQRYPKWRRWVYSFTAVAVALFIVFYPVLSGLTVPRWYTSNFTRWFDTWPF